MTAPPRCGGCAHFVADPAAIEAAIPGLASLGSALAAVRGQDGLCRHHDILLAASSRCADFVAAIAQTGPAPNISTPPRASHRTTRPD